MARTSSKKGRTQSSAAATPEIPPNRLMVESRQRLILWLVGLLLVALSLTIYVLRLDHVVGMAVDDAWYLLLAKAIATGQGYTLINSPTPGIHPFYSPGWPAVLALVFKLSPNFPDNVWIFKSVSIASMLGTGVLAFRYFRDETELPAYVALALATSTTLYPALVLLATSTAMSECFFTLIQFATIWIFQRAVRLDTSDRLRGAFLLGGVLASYAFLTRPMAIALLVGTFVYLLRQRLFRNAAMFAGIVLLLVVPWMLYQRRHEPTPEQQAEQGASIVQSYTKQLWQRVAGRPLLGTISAGDLPQRVWTNVSEIALYDFGGLVIYPVYRPLEPGDALRIDRTGRSVSLAIAVLALIGFVSVARTRMTLAEYVVPLEIGVSAVWGWEQFRFLLPLVPFLLYYTVMGVRALSGLGQKLYGASKPRGALVPMLLTSWFIVLNCLVANWQFIDRKYDPVPAYRLRWESTYAENEGFMKYIGKNIPQNEVICTQNPALLHLLTGHKTVASDDPQGQFPVWNKLGIRYMASTSAIPLPPPDKAEGKYEVVFRSNGPLGLRLIDLGSPLSRPAWGKD